MVIAEKVYSFDFVPFRLFERVPVCRLFTDTVLGLGWQTETSDSRMGDKRDEEMI